MNGSAIDPSGAAGAIRHDGGERAGPPELSYEPAEMPRAPLDEIDEVFADLDTLLKNPDVGATLTAAGVNTSLAMTLADGLRAYLHGDKKKALLELGTATEEIAARMAASGSRGRS